MERGSWNKRRYLGGVGCGAGLEGNDLGWIRKGELVARLIPRFPID